MDLINKQFDSTECIFSTFDAEQDATDRVEVKVFPVSTYPNIRNVGWFLYNRNLGILNCIFPLHLDVWPGGDRVSKLLIGGNTRRTAQDGEWCAFL